ncbi:MAG: AarF/ABC1/UbiB kinase family protein [Candidatus Woesearchaeota archaeon]
MGVLHKPSEVKRISHVVGVLFQHGLGYFIEELELKFHLPFFKKILRHKFKQPASPAQRFTTALEELGGAYVKLGQLLSIRPDLTNLEFSTECQRLQDRVKPFPFPEAKKIVEEELKKPLHSLFSHFQETPISSASIGQVYDARLRNSQRVAVKVQRPSIREEIEADIGIMTYFAKRMEKLEKFRKYRPTQIVEEFRRYTEDELDYTREAKNAERFYNNFKGHKTIKIPKIYWAYTTPKLITMEFIDGKKLTDLLQSHKPFDKHLIVREGLAAEYKQIFDDGFFHADLHPGNIMIVDGKTIALLDFGIAGRMDGNLQRQSAMLFLYMMDKNSKGVCDVLLALGEKPGGIDIKKFEQDIEAILYEWYGKDLSQQRVTKMLHKIFSLCTDHEIQLPIDLVLLGKALVTIEATCRLLEPEFDIIKSSKPYFTRIAEQQARLQARIVGQYYKRLRGMLVNLPETASTILDRIKEPHVKVDIEDKDIRKIGLEIDRSSNRLAYGILISAFVVAGAMMIGIDVGPKALEVPLISLAFFSIAAVLGAILIYSVMSEGK